jgi:glycosyltransferase involved in cell wall biosynthesis
MIAKQGDPVIEPPVVSVGVPVYNGERFMEACLKSIQDQTLTRWECVVVNNRSTDGTAEIVQKFVDADPRFRLFTYEEFAPVERNWNRLYRHVSEGSEYFKVVQADDIIYPEALEEMVGVMDRYPQTGMCSSYRINGLEVDCDGLNYFDGSVFSGRELLHRHLKGEIDITGAMTTPLFRRSVIERLPTFPDVFDETDYHLDTLLCYEMMHLADVAFVYKVLSITRWHEEAGTMKTVRLKTFMNGQENRLQRFKEFYPDLEPMYRDHRLIYAYTLFKQRLLGNRETLQWHRKYLKRPFTFPEKLKAILLKNGLVWRISRLFSRRKGASPAANLN